MRILRVAMRHAIESGGTVAARVVSATRPVRLASGLSLAFMLVVCVQVAHSESFAWKPVSQSGTISGVGSHGAESRGIPPHAPGYLGILFQNLTDEQVASLHLKTPHGVEVVMVDHDGPAGKAGLQPHDVIISLNGQMVSNKDVLQRMIHDAGVGAAISMLVLRGGRQITLNAQLAYRGEVEREAVARMVATDPPTGEDAPVADGADDPDPVAPDIGSRSHGFLLQMLHSTPFTGLMLEAMEPQLAGFFGAPVGVGLLVETVRPDSPAAAAGLRAGDVILKADSIEVKSTGAWVRLLHERRGRGIALVVLREKQEQTIMLIPELKKHSKVEWPGMFGVRPRVA
ncbi:MAG: PDZ domain-containing protein [Acidobacteriaceae bacterium]